MGLRVLLIAVTGKEPATIHDEYSVAPTSRHESIPKSPVDGTMLPSGAYLLYINDEIIPDRRVCERLSQNALLIACYANETIMNSFSCSWINGLEQWSVFHDARQGVGHLETTGTPSTHLKRIKERVFANHGEGDDEDAARAFEVPVDLFAELGGIRYDQEIEGAGPKPWEILVREKAMIRTGMKKWWLFG